MTEEELSEIEARVEDASPLPWGMQMRGPDSLLISVLSGKLVAVVPSESSDDIFIAASRQDVPDLCTALRAAWARIAELEAEGVDSARGAWRTLPTRIGDGGGE